MAYLIDDIGIVVIDLQKTASPTMNKILKLKMKTNQKNNRISLENLHALKMGEWEQTFIQSGESGVRKGKD